MDCAFLTGGTGFVGANLARLLIDKGFKVKALARPGSNRKNLEGLPVELIEGGLGDKDALKAGAKGCRYVFHVAADYRIWVTDPAEMYKSNVEGTVNLIEASRDCEKIVVCSSVAAVKLPNDHRPVNETSEYSSVDEIISDYKRSKWLSERAALALAAKGAPVVVVNPAAPIGPYDIKPTPTGRIVVDFMNGRIPSYIDTGMNVVHVADVAMGHYLAAQKGRLGQRYILGGENMTLKQVLDTLSAVTGFPAPSFKTPYAVALAFGALDTARARVFGGEPLAPLDAVRMAKHYMWFSSDKAKAELGYAPTPARQALADAAAWFKANGYIKREAALAMIQVDNETDELSATPTTGPVLICAATRWEAEPLAAALKLAPSGSRRWEGMLGERRVLLVQTGVGPVKAGEALDELANETFGIALSVGFAGALQPGIASGDIVCDIRGSDAALPPLARRIAAAQGSSIHFGRIAHSHRVLASPDDKRALGLKERASAVDMETQALRTWVGDRELPVLPVRVILDGLDDRLPRAVPSGEDFWSLVKYVLANLIDLPIMIATGIKQRRAIANLGRFLTEFLPLV